MLMTSLQIMCNKALPCSFLLVDFNIVSRLLSCSACDVCTSLLVVMM